MTPLSLGKRQLAPDQPVLVIAEIGVNHDGSLARGLELVEHARAGGADAVKLQLFRAETLMHASGAFAAYQEQRCPDASPADMLRRYELSPQDAARLVAAIADAGMLPLATPFSLPDLDLIAALDLPAIKIASPDLVNLPLLRRTAQLQRPLLLSTGAATIEEVAQTAQWLGQWQAPFALLHCVSSYPTPADQAHLGWIDQLIERFDVPVGFSDHTSQELAGALAVAAGALLVEKHLTYDRSAPGPDHAASADPGQFARYVQAIRLAQTLRGRGPKRVLDVEQDVRCLSRQSLVLARPLQPGQPIVAQDLSVQRPGSGIPAADFDRVLGQSSPRPLPAGTLLQWDMLKT